MALRLWVSIVAVSGAVLMHPATGANPQYAVTGQIDGPRGAWTFASIDPMKRRLYVGRTDGVLVIDLETHETNALTLGGKRVQMVVPVPDSDLIVGTEDTANMAVILDAVSGAVRAQIPAGRRPETAAYDAASGLVAVMAGSAEVTLIDVKAARAVGSIAVPGVLESGVSDGKGHLFINLEDRNAIAVVDLVTRKMTGTYALRGCSAPTGLGYDEKTHILLSSCDNEVAKAIDSLTGADRGTIKIPGGPDAVLVDSQRRVAFIPCSQGYLAVINLAGREPEWIESIPTAQGAQTGALDARSGHVYLPVGRAPATDFGGRAVPGFAVLIVERK